MTTLDPTAPAEAPDTIPPATMPLPRRTATDAARELLAAHEHVHLVSDGMTRCLNRWCDSGTQLLEGLM